MLQIDPWERAAECERYLQTEVDSTRREIFTNVRDLWIGLANARNFLTGAEFDQQIKTLDSIQADLIKPAKIKIH
ncbi:MAG: hypothetical protein ABWY92_13225 [Xanthobacteraceae bacterium]|jgi:hypothetical protein